MSLPEPGTPDLNSTDGSSWPTYVGSASGSVSAHRDRWLWHNGKVLLSTACAAPADPKQAVNATTLATVTLTGRNRFIHRSFRVTDGPPLPCRAKAANLLHPCRYAMPDVKARNPPHWNPSTHISTSGLLPGASSSRKGLGAASYCAAPAGESKFSRFVRFGRSRAHGGGRSARATRRTSCRRLRLGE